MIGPGGVPAPVVRFDLHSAAEGERDIVFALADWGYSGMGAEMPLDGGMLRLIFAPSRAQSLATASAGAAIAAAAQGRFDGAPETLVINLGVARPVRHLALSQRFAIGGLSLDGLMVRTADHGSTGGIAVEGEEPDSDELVVTAEKKNKRRLVLEVGADALSGCSSILFDKPAKRVTLRCR